MTTIVITETEIAWDSLQVFDGVERNISPIDKVRCPRPGVIVAFTGDCNNEQAIFDWIKAGKSLTEYSKKPDASYEIAVVTADGVWSHSDETPGGFRVSPPYCLGSGAKYARGALNHCKRKKLKISAKEAVEAAADSDVNTGGEIKSATIAKLLAMPKKRRPTRRK